MIRKFAALLLSLAALLSLVSCGKTVEEAPEDSSAAVTFTDSLGRTVTVDKPQRVACLLGSFAQIYMLSGGDVIATADDAWDDLALPMSEEAVNLGNTKSLSLEALLAASPDFILASTNTRQNVEWRDTLESIGIPVAYFDVSSFEDYLTLLKICTDITGRADLFEKHGTLVAAQIAAVKDKARTDSPTVLSMVASASAVHAKNSEGNVLGEMLRDMGCRNIADSNAMLLENLSLEYIVECDPDYIFFVQRGDDEEGMHEYVNELLLSNPAWNSLTAVQEGRVYFMEKTLYNLKPNHCWGEAYEKLETILNA